ncbi:MAG: hypothetical protein KF777_05235 [Planctomycetaceae bacterium]|nr:hypothetical protein [Planctomycetaceae bacterium]
MSREAEVIMTRPASTAMLAATTSSIFAHRADDCQTAADFSPLAKGLRLAIK